MEGNIYMYIDINKMFVYIYLLINRLDSIQEEKNPRSEEEGLQRQPEKETRRRRSSGMLPTLSEEFGTKPRCLSEFQDFHC